MKICQQENGFNFDLIDVGHHLAVGRVWRFGHASLVALRVAGLVGGHLFGGGPSAICARCLAYQLSQYRRIVSTRLLLT